MLFRSSRFVLALALVSGVAGSVLSARSWAQSTPVITFRTGEHESFDRIVFDAPKGTGYKLAREKNDVTIRFSVAARVLLKTDPLPRAEQFRVIEGNDGLKPLVVRFRVLPDTVLHDFYSETAIVIDVQGAPKGQKPSTEQKKSPEPPPVLTSQEPPPAPSVSLPEKREGGAQEDSAIEKEKQEAPTPQPAPLPPVEPTNPPPRQETPAFRSFVPQLDQDPAIVEEIQKIVKEEKPQPVAILDPLLPVGTAIFSRAGYITILFDRKLSGDALVHSPPPRVKLTPMDLPFNTGYRIAVPSNVDVRATRKGTAWEIYLIPAGKQAGLSTEFVMQPEFALGSRLLVATGQPPKPVVFPDPVVGDYLVVVPLQETGAFTLRRRLADFAVIPAAQGLVIRPFHDKVMARIVPDGVEITAEGGLHLSPTTDTGRYDGEGRTTDQHIYDFEKWRGTTGETFSQTKQKLMETIAEVPESERILARLDLARFYFAHGMGNESLAVLSLVQKDLPEIEDHPDFLALRGGVNILAGHNVEGLKDLNHTVLHGQTEAMFWKAIGAAGLRDWKTAHELFKLSFDVALRYPEPSRSRYLVLAIETAAAVSEDQQVAQWLDKLEKNGYAPEKEPAIRYLRGVLYSKAKRADMAEKLWRQVVQGNDRLYKIRAELALVDLGVATRSLTPKQAAERLEGLRFAWRGDDLELDILRRLGGFYFDANEFRNSIKMQAAALRLFPYAPQAKTLQEEMIQNFRDIFMQDHGPDFSPIEALSIYTDFKELIPEGEKGNDIRRNLAERLIAVDLLAPAAALLEDLFAHSSSQEDRAKTGTRLAAVHLLDHKAKEALTDLDKSAADAQGASQDIQDQRERLRARAYSELGDYHKALEVLPHDDKKSTKLLRADMAMRATDWNGAKTALMDLVGAPPAKGMIFDDEKADWLVKAAVAMAMTDDTAGLDRLAIDYDTAMQGTNKSNLFRVLTRPEKVTQMKDIRAAQANLTEVDMFRGILDSYRVEQK